MGEQALQSLVLVLSLGRGSLFLAAEVHLEEQVDVQQELQGC